MEREPHKTSFRAFLSLPPSAQWASGLSVGKETPDLFHPILPGASSTHPLHPWCLGWTLGPVLDPGRCLPASSFSNYLYNLWLSLCNSTAKAFTMVPCYQLDSGKSLQLDFQGPPSAGPFNHSIFSPHARKGELFPLVHPLPLPSSARSYILLTWFTSSDSLLLPRVSVSFRIQLINTDCYPQSKMFSTSEFLQCLLSRSCIL